MLSARGGGRGVCSPRGAFAWDFVAARGRAVLWCACARLVRLLCAGMNPRFLGLLLFAPVAALLLFFLSCARLPARHEVDLVEGDGGLLLADGVGGDAPDLRLFEERHAHLLGLDGVELRHGGALLRVCCARLRLLVVGRAAAREEYEGDDGCEAAEALFREDAGESAGTGRVGFVILFHDTASYES